MSSSPLLDQVWAVPVPAYFFCLSCFSSFVSRQKYKELPTIHTAGWHIKRETNNANTFEH